MKRQAETANQFFRWVGDYLAFFCIHSVLGATQMIELKLEACQSLKQSYTFLHDQICALPFEHLMLLLLSYEN